jgi:hypothetical protein
MGVFALGGVSGALAAYFFDPGNGAGRRRKVRDGIVTVMRLGVQPTGGESREVSAEAHGFSQKVKDEAKLAESNRA